MRQKERFCLILPGSARMLLVCEKPPLLQNGTVIGGAHMRGRWDQGATPVSGRVNLEAVLQIGSLLYRKEEAFPPNMREKHPKNWEFPQAESLKNKNKRITKQKTAVVRQKATLYIMLQIRDKI